MNKRYYFFLGSLVFLSTTFSQKKLHSTGDDSMNLRNALDVISKVRQKYAPDHRVAVFDVVAIKNGENIIVKGEVGSTEIREAVLASLRKGGIQHVKDSIAVLPDASCRENPYGIVVVSVAPIRAKPAESAEMVSQALMGSAVRVLKQKRGWVYIQTVDENYLGWMDNSQFVQVKQDGYEHWVNAPLVITTAYIERVLLEPSDSSQQLCDVTAGALLSGKEYNADWFSVTVADGRTGYISRKSAVDYQEWKESRNPTSANIEKTAKRFLGVPYLWGGSSPKGFDCSGFTKTVYKLNGISLPRDADQQGLVGEPVPLDNDYSQLRKGDLLFFGDKESKEKLERITHVAIYLGQKEFIHCSGLVKINSFEPKSPKFSEHLLSRLVKAKRFLKEK